MSELKHISDILPDVLRSAREAWATAILTPFAHECPRHATEARVTRTPSGATLSASCGCTAVVTRPDGPDGYASIAWDFKQGSST